MPRGTFAFFQPAKSRSVHAEDANRRAQSSRGEQHSWPTPNNIGHGRARLASQAPSGGQDVAGHQRETVPHGGRPGLPFALVEHGSRPGQRVVTGTLLQLPDLARQHGVTAPAVLLLGEIAALATQLHCYRDPRLVADATPGQPQSAFPQAA
jgi:hypothetical protein